MERESVSITSSFAAGSGLFGSYQCTCMLFDNCVFICVPLGNLKPTVFHYLRTQRVRNSARPARKPAAPWGPWVIGSQAGACRQNSTAHLFHAASHLPVASAAGLADLFAAQGPAKEKTLQLALHEALYYICHMQRVKSSFQMRLTQASMMGRRSSRNLGSPLIFGNEDSSFHYLHVC